MSKRGGQASGSDLDAEDLDKLIGAVARAEDGAFDLLFRQLFGPVYCMALTVVCDAAQAEEVAQDVLTEMWRTAGRYDPSRSSAVSWALMIARRRAIDRVRSVTADARRERLSPATTVSWDEASERADEISDREQLRGCLGTLSDAQHEAIMLAFYGGYTYPDIAILLGVPVGTVKTRIRAALVKLRNCMRTRG